MTQQEKEYVRKLEKALTDLVDGSNPCDIRDETGLSEERCTEIYKLFLKIISEKD